jgi:hypothetical protein
MIREITAINERTSHAVQTGIPDIAGNSTRNRENQMRLIRYGGLKILPHCVRSVAFTASPKPGETKKMTSISAVAAILHFTQAEMASTNNASKTIQIKEPSTNEPAIQ